jgi:hypothetical protein
VLLGVLALLISAPLGRTVFEISTLILPYVAVIGGAALLWMLLLRLVWRFRLLGRVLGIESERAPASGH